MKPPSPAVPGRARKRQFRKPSTPEAAAVAAALSATRYTRRAMSKKARALISHYVESGQRDPYISGQATGYSRPSEALRIINKFSDVVAAEAARRNIGKKMEMSEALELVARLAREALDAKLRLAALRTVLEVEGGLANKSAGVVERGAMQRQLEKIVDEIRAKMSGKGISSRIRARVEKSSDGAEKRELDIVLDTVSSPENHALSPSDPRLEAENHDRAGVVDAALAETAPLMVQLEPAREQKTEVLASPTTTITPRTISRTIKKQR